MATGATDFPSGLTPTQRTYTPGEYPTQEFVSLDGTKTYLRYGNKASEAKLNLTFGNITDTQAASIIANYKEVNETWTTADEKTRWVRFQTTSNTLDGLEGTLPTYVEESDLRWRYAKPPKVTSVQKGISNVTCSFVACLDSPKLS